MKLKFKHICVCSMVAVTGMLATSCEDFLDRQPITDLTPESYFTTADQVAAYTVQYYVDQLKDSRDKSLTHETPSYNSCKTRNDDMTDNLFVEQGSLTYLRVTSLCPQAGTLRRFTKEYEYGTGCWNK